MPGNYTVPTRQPGELITSDIYNSDHQLHVTNNTPPGVDDYSSNIVQMQAQVDPGDVGSENLAVSLAGEIERLRFTIARLAGTTFWYEIGGAVRLDRNTTVIDVPAVDDVDSIEVPNAFPIDTEARFAGGNVLVSFGTTRGLTGIQLVDPDEGAIWTTTPMGITAGSKSTTGQQQNRMYRLINTTARSVVLIAIGGRFDATGTIRVTTYSESLILA